MINVSDLVADIFLKKGFKMLEVATRIHGPKFSLYPMPAVTSYYLNGIFSIISVSI